MAPRERMARGVRVAVSLLAILLFQAARAPWLLAQDRALLSQDRAVLAQDTDGFSIGLVAGSPGGLSARFEPTSWPRPIGPFGVNALSALVSFDLDDYFLFQAHVMDERPVRNSPITVFAGPGIAVGRSRSHTMLGVGGVLGIRFFRSRFEILMQLHPRLMFAPRLYAFPGAGVGFRFRP